MLNCYLFDTVTFRLMLTLQIVDVILRVKACLMTPAGEGRGTEPVATAVTDATA